MPRLGYLKYKIIENNSSRFFAAAFFEFLIYGGGTFYDKF